MDRKFSYSPEVIVEVPSNRQPLVYPNPATSSTVKIINGTEKISRLVIYNLAGKIVKTIPGSNENAVSFSIASMSNGIYVVKISTRSGESIQKLVVSR